MAIIAYQVPYDQDSGNGLVTPVVDRKLYESLMTREAGVASGLTITASGTNLILSSGWGAIKGCIFNITSETVAAQTPSSGTALGRLLIDLDVTNGTIELETQQGASLPALIQEDINGSGSIYQMELATYSVTDTAITNLVTTFQEIFTTAEALSILSDNITTVSNNAVPKTRKIAGQTLEADRSLADLGAVPKTRKIAGQTLEADRSLADLGAVPTSRTINGNALTGNVTVTRDQISGIVKSSTTSTKTLTMALSGTTLTITY